MSEGSPQDDACVPEELIRRAACDEASPQEADRVARHLDECEECRRRFDRALPLSDQVDRLREATTVAPDAQEQDMDWSGMVERAGVTVVAQAGRVTLPNGLVLESPRHEGYLARLGSFDVVSVVGQGGMGIVLRAYEEALDRHVALKVMSPRLLYDEQARQRFLREARAAARLNHPNIVTIHAVGEAGSVPYIAMEFIEGESLGAVIDREAPMDAGRAAGIAREMLLGLEHAHRAGIVHRDVKPGNVIIGTEGGRVKITDFGLARGVADAVRLTREGTTTGTPWYMSPEQARGARDLDARSDLFSVGVVLFEMLTGALPFPGESSTEVMRKIARGEGPDVRALRPSVPFELAGVVRRAMERSPRRRYQTATEFAGDLERFVTASRTTVHREAVASQGRGPGAEGGGSGSSGTTFSGRCSACSGVIVSQLSAAGACEVCGEPICSTCWQARGVRHCAEHAEQAKAGEGARLAERLERTAEESKTAGAEAAAAATAEGGSVVSAREARVGEQTFLRLAESALEGLGEVVDPLSGERLSVRSWAGLAQRTDRAAELRDALGPSRRRTEATDQFPVGAGVVYQVRRGGLGRRRPSLVVEARSLTHLERFARDGHDDAPSSRTELEALLNEAARAAAAGAEWHLVIAYSPTGWDAAARDLAVAGGRQGFRDRLVSVVLFDHERGGFIYDETDEKLAPCVREAFAPTLDRAALQEAQRFARDYVELHGSISLDHLAEELGLSRVNAARVLDSLSGEGGFVLEQMAGVGVVLYRPTHRPPE